MIHKASKQLWTWLILGSFFFASASVARGQVSKHIEATVAISVCGNGVIESGEQCEGDNLAGATCTSRGYINGALSCDVACDWDTSGCAPASPRASSLPVVRRGPVLRLPLIPVSVQYFDTDNNGTIELPELYGVVAAWVEFWRQDTQTAAGSSQCDVNRDSVCDIQDLSILLSYVGR